MSTKYNYFEVKERLEKFYPQLIEMPITSIDEGYYGVIILQGSLICESMLKLIIEEEGYQVDEKGLVVIDNQQPNLNMTLLSFASHNEEIFPRECREFIDLIRVYRDQTADETSADYETAIIFAKALDYFSKWFFDYLIAHDIIRGTERELFRDRIHSLEQILESKGAFFRKYQVKTNIPHVRKEGISYDISFESKTVNNTVLQKLSVQIELLIDLMKKVDRVEKHEERIEQKVDEIHKQIKEVTDQISAYQSLVERQLINAGTKEETERIIQSYTDECVNKIVEETQSRTEQVLFEQEKRKLVSSLGENAWEKMEEASQTFLISAKVMYNRLIMLDDIIDYSGVCLLVTKALEVEMDKRFYSKFLNYLDSRYHRNYSRYPTALVFHNRAPLRPEKFTMGSIAYVLCYLEDDHDSSYQKINNKNKLIEYCKNVMFIGKTDSEINTLVTKYARDVENIRIKYRNPSAHTNEIKRVNAEECFNFVLDVQKVLKEMLDSFSI